MPEQSPLTFEHAQIGIAIADATGRFMRVNRRFCEIVGYEAEELLKWSVAHISHPDDVGPASAFYGRIARGESNFETFNRRYIRKDGGITYAHVSLSASSDGSRRRDVVEVVEDITQQREANEALRNRELQLSESQRIAHIGSWAIDVQALAATWSDETFRILGFPIAEGVPRAEVALARVHPEDRDMVSAAVLGAIREQRPFAFECRIVVNEQERAVHAEAQSGEAGTGSPKLIGFIQDITEGRRAENEARNQARQQAALAQIGNIALANASLAFLFEQVTEIIRDVLDIDRCEIYKAAGKDVLLVANSGSDQALIGQTRVAGRNASQIAHALKTLQPVIVEDVRTDTRFEPEPDLLRAGMTSGLAVPIAGGEAGPWGALGAHSRRRRTFSQSELTFTRAVALMLGQVIDRRQIEVELRVRLQQQSAIAELGRLAASDTAQNMLERACELAMNGLSVEYSSFLALSDDGKSFQPIAGHRWDHRGPILLNDSDSGHALRSDQAVVVVADFPGDPRFAASPYYVPFGIRSGIAVSVATAEHRFGVLAVHTRVPKNFTDADVHFMQSLASLLIEALDRERSRRALIESEQRFRSVVEGASEIIFSVAVTGEVISLNPAFEVITGWQVEEWIGRNFVELAPEEERPRMAAILASLVAEPRHVNLLAPMKGKAGQTLLVEVSASPKIVGGAVAEIYGFARDVTDQRRIEEERNLITTKLEQAHRLTSLGRLAATVAHEFNNVLMGISPFVDLLRREQLEERSVSAVEQISRSVKRGKRITEEILRFTQPADPMLGSLDLGPWLTALALEMRPLLGPKFSLDVDMNPPDLQILGDANQLHQSFVNLLLNARDAMTGGGRIVIHARLEPDDARFPFGVVDSPERFAHIVVEDSGHGMSPETLNHIFEPLFTTKKSGTGLGLSVTRQVVTRHGGEIFAESAVGSGTKFHIFIPLARSGSSILTSSAPSPRGNRRYSHVLIVEDERPVAMGLAALLEAEGVSVQIVDNGHAVMPAIARKRPDVVILDIGLPDMDGTAVYEEIAIAYPRLPVLFSSGHADETKLERHLSHRHVSFLLKPYDIETLLRSLDQVVG